MIVRLCGSALTGPPRLHAEELLPDPAPSHAAVRTCWRRRRPLVFSGRASNGRPRRRSSSRPPPLVEAGPSPTMKAQHPVRSVGAANRFRIRLSRRAGCEERSSFEANLTKVCLCLAPCRACARFADCRGGRPFRGLPGRAAASRTARAWGRFADCPGVGPLRGLPGRGAASRTAGGRGGRPIRGAIVPSVSRRERHGYLDGAPARGWIRGSAFSRGRTAGVHGRFGAVIGALWRRWGRGARFRNFGGGEALSSANAEPVPEPVSGGIDTPLRRLPRWRARERFHRLFPDWKLFRHISRSPVP
jgi:hypothetical protein